MRMGSSTNSPLMVSQGARPNKLQQRGGTDQQISKTTLLELRSYKNNENMISLSINVREAVGASVLSVGTDEKLEGDRCSGSPSCMRDRDSFTSELISCSSFM